MTKIDIISGFLGAGKTTVSYTHLDVYKRQHVSFGALSVALAAGWSPLKISIPVVVLAAFFLLRITERGKIKSDAAIAMISASALAIGIIAVSYTHLAPDGALIVCRELGMQPGDCLYLGDTNTDMKTGIAAGMDTVGVTWGFRDREELVALSPQYLSLIHIYKRPSTNLQYAAVQNRLFRIKPIG